FVPGSTTGTKPQSRSHMTRAASDSVESGEHVATSVDINLRTFMIVKRTELSVEYWPRRIRREQPRKYETSPRDRTAGQVFANRRQCRPSSPVVTPGMCVARRSARRKNGNGTENRSHAEAIDGQAGANCEAPGQVSEHAGGRVRARGDRRHPE